MYVKRESNFSMTLSWRVPPSGGLNRRKAELRTQPRRGVLTAAASLALAVLAGCAVPVHRQRLVSKPNMQFSDSPVFNYQSKVLSQVESGAAASGGAQAAGCTSCR